MLCGFDEWGRMRAVATHGWQGVDDLRQFAFGGSVQHCYGGNQPRWGLCRGAAIRGVRGVAAPASEHMGNGYAPKLS